MKSNGINVESPETDAIITTQLHNLHDFCVVVVFLTLGFIVHRGENKNHSQDV